MTINLSEIQLKPIEADAGFEEAYRYIDLLVDADLIENPTERMKALDLLEAIAIRVIDYEEKHFPMPWKTAK